MYSVPGVHCSYSCPLGVFQCIVHSVCVPTAGRRTHTLKSNSSLVRGFGADPDGGDSSPDRPSTGPTRGKFDKTVPLTNNYFSHRLFTDLILTFRT